MPVTEPDDSSTAIAILKWFAKPSHPHTSATLWLLTRVMCCIKTLCRQNITDVCVDCGNRPLLITGCGDGTPLSYRHHIFEIAGSSSVKRSGKGTDEFYCCNVFASFHNETGRRTCAMILEEPTPMSCGKTAWAEVTPLNNVTEKQHLWGSPINENNNETNEFITGTIGCS